MQNLIQVNELKACVEEANKHLKDHQQRNLNITKKKSDLERQLCQNKSVGKTNTTVEEKERWQDLRCRTKEKLSYKKKSSANKTGRGPAKEIALTNAELRLSSSISL